MIDLKKVKWYCDECGSYLNDQEGFTTDQLFCTCTKCGWINTISEEDILTDEQYNSFKSSGFTSYNDYIDDYYQKLDEKEQAELEDKFREELKNL